MSHYLVEVPKEPPLKGCWILIAAKNWIYEDVLYTPDNSYSHAYKLSLLKDGKDPDIITWERSHSFKVIHQFDSYEEARENLPRAEKGLPVFTRSSDIGRGHRQRIEKSLKLPGELSTTEQESEQEEDSLSQTKKSTVKKKSTPVKRKSSSETTKLPLPPPTLRSKSKNVTQNSSNKIAKSTVKIPSVGTALAGPSVLSDKKKDRCNTVNNVRSCSTQVMSFQKSNEIQEKQYDNDMHIDSDSSEEVTPNSSNKIAKSTVKIPSVGTALAGPSVLSNKKKDRCNAVNNVRSCSTQVMSFQKSKEIQEKQYDNDMHIDSDSSEEDFPGNTHGDTNDLQSIPPYRNDSQMMTIYTPQPTPSPSPCEPSDNSQQYSGNYKKNVDKGGMVAKVVLTTLAQMNEKLSVLEKTMAKPVAEVSEDEDDDLAFLPVKSIGDFEKFERNLKQNKDVFRKLVSMITRLGKRNTKNSHGDYVRRAWGCVIANSVAKELNWLGRPDKRVNNGLGKRGIKESLITKAIQRGISSNKDFREMEISAFECETKAFLKNSKATYDRKANAPGKDGEDSEDTTENY